MSPAPRLLHLFSTFAAGGPQVRTATLIHALGPAFRHVVVALDGDFACRERLASAPADVVAYEEPPRRGALPGNVLRFARLVDRVAPDLVLTYNWGAIEAVVGARIAGRPLIHVEDGFGPEEAERLLFRRVAFRRVVLPFARKVVVPSRVLERIARERWRVPDAKLVHVPNGIDLDRFAPAAADDAAARARRDELRRQWGARADEVVVGTVARLRAEKGLELLVESFAAQRARSPAGAPARLVIVGDGPEEPRLRADAQRLGVAERVTFAGAADDARDSLRGFDLFALTSRTEQMPVSLLEAMGCGLAAVATDVGDVAAMVAESNRPFVRAGRDARALAEALATLCDDAARRGELGTANRAKALAEYSLATMVGRWRGLFEYGARG